MNDTYIVTKDSGAWYASAAARQLDGACHEIVGGPKGSGAGPQAAFKAVMKDRKEMVERLAKLAILGSSEHPTGGVTIGFCDLAVRVSCYDFPEGKHCVEVSSQEWTEACKRALSST